VHLAQRSGWLDFLHFIRLVAAFCFLAKSGGEFLAAFIEQSIDFRFVLLPERFEFIVVADEDLRNSIDDGADKFVA